MQVSVETTGSLERKMTVRVPAERIENEVEARLKRVGRSVKLKGFRPGKVPRKVLAQRYGGQVRQEVLSELVQSSFAEAVEQERLQPAGGPRIETDGIEEGQDFSYTAVFEIFPDVAVSGVESIEIERPEVEVTDEDVEDMLGRLREQRGTWEAVERKAGEGDRVVVDFRGTVKGEPFEGGEGTDVPIVLGAGQMLEDFEKGLYGVGPGDETTIKLKFPKDYRAEELAGKKAEFAVTVKSVEERHLPEVDEAFVESFGIENGDLDQLKSEVRANMERELDERVRAAIKNQALEGLLKANPIEVPKVMVEQEIQSLRESSMRRMGVEDPEQGPPPSAFEETARRRVAIGLLVNEIVTRESIQVDPERLRAKIEELAANYERPEEIVKLYQSNPQLRTQLEMAVIEEQVVDWLAERAAVKPKPASFREFMDG